jgi:hypothetical protein
LIAAVNTDGTILCEVYLKCDKIKHLAFSLLWVNASCCVCNN